VPTCMRDDVLARHIRLGRCNRELCHIFFFALTCEIHAMCHWCLCIARVVQVFGHKLSAATGFTALTLFNGLRMPLSALPSTINDYIQASGHAVPVLSLDSAFLKPVFYLLAALQITNVTLSQEQRSVPGCESHCQAPATRP
jgi:hypothetical protein